MSVDRYLILEGIVGSTAHGTGVSDQDDLDLMGVAIESPRLGIGINMPKENWTWRTQPEGTRSGPGDTDSVVYSLRKFCRLALGGNPSILTLLFLPKYETVNEVGDGLLDLAPCFHSQSAGKAFLGYMQQQRQRLEGTRGQKNVTRPELVERYGYDTKYAGHIIRLGLQGVEYLKTGRLTLPMPAEQAAEVVMVRTGQVDKTDVLFRAADLEDRLKALLHTVAPRPDKATVEAWMVRTYLDLWRGWR